jgi:hypothetical protein
MTAGVHLGVARAAPLHLLLPLDRKIPAGRGALCEANAGAYEGQTLGFLTCEGQTLGFLTCEGQTLGFLR